MLIRYTEMCEGRRPLGGAAYFCLTVLRLAARGGNRDGVAKRFGIASSVFKKLGTLTDAKGGREARKAKGAKNEFTDAERTWLQEVMKTIFRRAAEVAYDPAANQYQITMADLPPLRGAPAAPSGGHK
jgi:hypothetical protein